MRKTFTQKLFRWYSLYKRNLPWIGSNDPYKVWLSEVILQQTRVEQGLSYYQKFVKKYPDIQQLANSPHDEVMKMWEGLGYYSRARNMHSTAKQVVEELNGRFPDTYEGLIQLKGIGQYTAHAILSYAYKKPFAVVDGNVLRVLARYFGIREAIDTPKGKSLIQQQADSLLDKKEPDVFNQAMMDFGALICKPRQPD
ncbi:MAG TPA: A/G-specific adenine glycosylase, partial [Chitinophagales bacterium]|nr:A/G-specific adenine glycosylase [Chitinophagales bacterium]